LVSRFRNRPQGSGRNGTGWGLRPCLRALDVSSFTMVV